MSTTVVASSKSAVRHTEPSLLVSVTQAANLLQISKATVWRMIAAGKLRSVHVGKLRRIRRADIERLIRK